MDPIHACEKHHCDQCPKDFSTNYGVLRHKKKTHSNENIRINCPKCSLTFGCLQDLGYQDNLTHTGLKPYICSNLLCNRAFETPYLLHKHKQLVPSFANTHHGSFDHSYVGRMAEVRVEASKKGPP
ncbi:zinc finger protein 728-like [Aphis craccivora]|uniref:Zinc finger protein 728-like n=1 Tax=Aphis craccivora TaxID=307492 RepID=A0A6G0YCX3_APHCR|nr:zinc finger protein 728-like [Aphis craccivora]